MENKNPIYNNIKSKYILKRIFKNLNKNKFFNIIKYNKILQKIFGLGINDYKDNFEKIIIEIIPKNFYRYDFHKEDFIIFKESNNSFYHIFFDDENDEFKSCDVDNYERIKKIKINYLIL